MHKIKGQTLFCQSRSCFHLFVVKDFAATLDKRQNSIFADFSFEQDLCALEFLSFVCKIFEFCVKKLCIIKAFCDFPVCD